MPKLEGKLFTGHDILETIVFPSASFVPGFEIYNVETKTDIYSGVRGEDTTDAITLVTGPHAEIRIPRKQIVSIKPSNVSLMPEGLDESITRPEFIDLLAFLQSQKSREMAQVGGEKSGHRSLTSPLGWLGRGWPGWNRTADANMARRFVERRAPSLLTAGR